jgi:CheY-like chemotaxis protein/HPt (histidine-containing phosphotransfer) domain-containing protein
LLVEDNRLNQILAQKVLSDWGWKVETADNGIIALDKIRKENFDLILMDIQMPEMDGYEATHYIREKLSPPKSSIPIIAITAHAISGEEEKCYKAGMDGYVSKPFNPQNLYQKIRHILHRKKNGVHQHGKEEYNMKNNVMKTHTDLTYLKGIANGSNEFITQMLNTFIEQTPQSLTRMENALKKKDWKSLRLIVHKIKPSITFTGLNEIINDIPVLEGYAAEESHLEAIPELVDKIKRVCTEALEELKEDLKELQ